MFKIFLVFSILFVAVLLFCATLRYATTEQRKKFVKITGITIVISTVVVALMSFIVMVF